jgi:hypothetical protein
MSLTGKWRITKMPDLEAGYPDMVELAWILFEDKGSGAFALGCCTGHIWRASSTEPTSIDFSWSGNAEMDEVSADGSAELPSDGFPHGEIFCPNGDDWAFIARKWISSTAR